MAKGSAIVLLSLVASGFLSMGTRIFLARVLSPSDYGLFFSVFVFISFLAVFRNLGLTKAISKYIPQYKTQGEWNKIISTIINSSFIMGISSITISFFVIFSSEWLAKNFFGTTTASHLLLILSFWFIVTGFVQILRAIFRGFKDMLGRAGIELLRLSSTLGFLIFGSIFLKLTLPKVAIFYLLGSIISVTIFSLFLNNRHLESLKGSGSINKSLCKKILLFSFPLVLSGLAAKVMGRIDTMMITYFRSSKDVGFYQVARPTAKFLRYFGIALAMPLMPMVSELWSSKNIESLRSTLRFLSKIVIILIIPPAILLLTFPEPVIRLLFGAEYLAAGNALRILAGATIFQAGGAILGSVLVGTDKTDLVFKSRIAATIFNVPANFLLIPKYGATGAAIATGLSYLILLGLSFRYVKETVEFSFPWKQVLKALTGGGITLSLVWGLKTVVNLSPWIEVISFLTPSIGVYIIWILKTGALSPGDLRLLKEETPIPEEIVKLLRRISNI